MTASSVEPSFCLRMSRIMAAKATPLAMALERKVAFVSGTTGLTEAQLDQLNDAAARIPVLWSANFSLGVALLKRMAAIDRKSVV